MWFAIVSLFAVGFVFVELLLWFNSYVVVSATWDVILGLWVGDLRLVGMLVLFGTISLLIPLFGFWCCLRRVGFIDC